MRNGKPRPPASQDREEHDHALGFHWGTDLAAFSQPRICQRQRRATRRRRGPRSSPRPRSSGAPTRK